MAQAMYTPSAVVTPQRCTRPRRRCIRTSRRPSRRCPRRRRRYRPTTKIRRSIRPRPLIRLIRRNRFQSSL